MVADCAEATGQWSEIAFLDDAFPTLAESGGWRVVGTAADLPKMLNRYDACVVAFGNCRARVQMIERARQAGFAIPSIVHPTAVVSKRARIHAGAQLLAGSIVNCGSEIGPGCIVNTAATIDHDCKLDSGVHVCPGAHLAGDVHIGARTWFGIGAVARQGIRIGADVTVGAGAVCVTNIRDGVTVMGVPARERERRKDDV